MGLKASLCAHYIAHYKLTGAKWGWALENLLTEWRSMFYDDYNRL